MEIPSQFVEQIIEHSPVSMQVLDADGMTVRVNSAFLRLFGLQRRDQAEGVFNLRTDPIVLANGLTEQIERAFRGEVVHTPASLFRSDLGPPRVIRAVIFPVCSVDGAIQNVVLVHEDVTELQVSSERLDMRSAQITVLEESFRRITNELSTGAVLENALDAMERLCSPDACAVWRLTPDAHWTCIAARNLSPEYQGAIEAAYLHGIEEGRGTFQSVRQNRPVAIDDVEASTLADPIREAARRERIRRVRAAPMRSGDAVDGALMVYGHTPGRGDSVDLEMLALLADQTAIALHNADLYESARAAAAETRVLVEISNVLTRSLSLPEILRSLTETVAPLMGLDRVAVSRVDEERDESVLVAYTGLDPVELHRWGADKPRRLSEQPESTRRLVETGEPLVLDEIPPEMLASLDEEQRQALAAFDIRSILVVAMREGERTIGTMSFDSPGQARHWTARDIRLAEGVAAQASVAIRNARLFEEAQQSRERLEERVRERTQELRAAHSEVISSERLAAVGIMAREVAHGLRNPLNVISTSLYYLKSRFVAPDEKVSRHFETISRAVEQSANMINQLMNLAGPRRPDFAPVDLNELTQRALQDRFTAEEVQWEARWGEDLPYVHGDWTQLSHAVKALVGNAASAGDYHGPIYVQTCQENGHVILAVGDHRPSIAEEEKQNLFEPFFVSATQWTGLGLSVAKQIAVRHGGDVTVDEQDGITWFRMTLPVSGER